MVKQSSTYPRDFFLYILSIAMLYVSVVSVLVLLFQYINVLFPDPLTFSQYSYMGTLDTIRWFTAMLFIVYPVYLLCTWYLQRELAADPKKAEYRIRKWLLYFTLFLAGLIIIGDLVTLLYNFLSGELTIRFLLKILAVAVVSGVVFGYELWDARRTKFSPSSTQRAFGWGSAALVLLTIVSGFLLVGSPAHQRDLRLDQQRINDLSTIQYQILNYWQQTDELPASLDDLTDSIGGFSAPTDPITGDPYEYTVTGNLSFDLCATFDALTPKPLRNLPNGNRSPYPDPYESNWTHNAGRTCFERTIDPRLYGDENGKLPRPIPAPERF